MPAIPAQKYEHSTFYPAPYQEPCFPHYPSPYAVDAWNYQAMQPQKQLYTLSAPKKMEGSIKGAVI